MFEPPNICIEPDTTPVGSNGVTCEEPDTIPFEIPLNCVKFTCDEAETNPSILNNVSICADEDIIPDGILLNPVYDTCDELDTTVLLFN